jgi:TetR/AcrR family transcriptional repressor of lmrAB and yxaGH operons
MVDSDARDRMVRSALQLLARNGVQATSFSQVLDHAKAPRGSVYHYFPSGKEQLLGEALDLASHDALAFLDRGKDTSPSGLTERFISMWRAVLAGSDFEAGCAVLAVAVTSDEPALSARASDIFRRWRQQLASRFAAAGVSDEESVRFAATLIAATEGAVVLSRAEASLEPFDLVAAHIVEAAARLTSANGR